MSAEGKSCFKCGELLTDEDLKNIVYWSETTNSDVGSEIIRHIGFPDAESVVCYRCLGMVQLEVYGEILIRGCDEK